MTDIYGIGYCIHVATKGNRTSRQIDIVKQQFEGKNYEK